jgi:hypothetical protein
MKFSAGDHESIDYVTTEGEVRTLRPRDGVFSTDDGQAIAALRGFDLAERTDAQVRASRARRTTRTREEAGETAKVVTDPTTGEQDTRGPGAPAGEKEG